MFMGNIHWQSKTKAICIIAIMFDNDIFYAMLEMFLQTFLLKVNKLVKWYGENSPIGMALIKSKIL